MLHVVCRRFTMLARRAAWVAALLTGLGLSFAAYAQNVVGPWVSVPGVMVSATVLTGQPKSVRTPNDLVAATASTLGNWQPLRADQRYAMGYDTPMWMRLEVDARQASRADPLVLSFVQPQLDHVRIWVQPEGQPAPSDEGAVAGQHVPRSVWQRPGAFVQHTLPPLGPGTHAVWVQVVQEMPWRPLLLVSSAREADLLRESHLSRQVGALGFLMATVVLAAVLALIQRSATHAWLAACGAASVLTLATFNGLAGLWLWPRAHEFSERALPIFSAIMLGSLLMCARSAQAARGSRRLLATRTCAVLWIVLGAACVWFLRSPTAHLNIGVWVVLALIILVLMCWQIWHGRSGDHWGRALIWLVCVAIGAVGAAAVAIELWGWVRWSDRPMRAITLAVLWQACVIGVAVALYGQRLTKTATKNRVQAQFDPLSGALEVLPMRQLIARSWRDARGSGQSGKGAEVALAYVRLRAPPDVDRVLARARAVRLLRTVARGQDSVGLIDGHTIALLMPGLGVGLTLRTLLARVVALSLMNDATDEAHVPLSLRIAVATRGGFGDAVEMMDASLRATFDPKREDWGDQSIRWLDRPAAKAELARHGAPKKKWWKSSLSAETGVPSEPTAGDSMAPR
jgi:7TM diverse intracellular signalling/7TMR-DISM extracellular 2